MNQDDMDFSDPADRHMRPGATAGQFDFVQPGNGLESEPASEVSNDLD